MADNSIDNALLQKMFDTIRADEISNSRTKKYNDKQMGTRIANFILKQVEKEDKKGGKK